MSIQEASGKGLLAPHEVERLRLEDIKCPKCGRDTIRGEVEDWGSCVNCSLEDEYEAEQTAQSDRDVYEYNVGL